jgi:hypothetical protein
MNKKQGFMLRLNKKGAEKWLSIWWYICLAIVLAGIVIIVYRFQSVTNVSELDAGILTAKIERCLVDNNNNLKFNVDANAKPELYSMCKIKFRPEVDYYIGLQIYDLATCTKTADKICSSPVAFDYTPNKYIHGDLMDRCLTLEGIKVTQMPDCSYKTIIATGKDGKQYALRIIGGINE